MFFRGIRVYFVKCINAYTGFGGTVLGQDYWDTTLEFLIYFIIGGIYNFIIYYIIYYIILVFTNRPHLLNRDYIRTSYGVH